MTAKDGSADTTHTDSWRVYLVECRDGTFYAGIATDIARRMQEHDEGRGAKYTRGRGPVRLLAVSRTMNRQEASRIEARIKRLPKHRKLGAMSALGDPTAAQCADCKLQRA